MRQHIIDFFQTFFSTIPQAFSSAIKSIPRIPHGIWWLIQAPYQWVNWVSMRNGVPDTWGNIGKRFGKSFLIFVGIIAALYFLGWAYNSTFLTPDSTDGWIMELDHSPSRITYQPQTVPNGNGGTTTRSVPIIHPASWSALLRFKVEGYPERKAWLSVSQAFYEEHKDKIGKKVRVEYGMGRLSKKPVPKRIIE